MAERADRLFVPLATDPYHWFASGQKRWEVRRLARGFALQHVGVGRRVELRRGYSTPDSLWGSVTEVVTANGFEALFERVPFAQVIPVAGTADEAIQIAEKILQIEPQEPIPLIAFKVELDS